MRTVEIALVRVPENRQRQEGKTSKDVAELKKSIMQKGLLHPPVLIYDPIGATFTLLAGERRMLAMGELHEDSLPFAYDAAQVPLGTMPYTLIAELEPADLREAELEENLLRRALTWQEVTRAKVEIHNLRKAQNPEQRLVDTAEEIVKATQPEPTPAAILAERQSLVRDQVVAAHLDMPSVASAPSREKAYQHVLADRKRRLERDLIQLNPVAAPHTCIAGDARTVLPTLGRDVFDLILCDPPYGINAHTAGGAGDGGDTGHQYDDTPSYAIDLCRSILRHGFNLLKPKGTVFMFCDVEHFITLRTIAEQQAFSTFRTPLIWHKGSEGHAPWGRDGFKRTYECILYAVKGQRPLAIFGGSDVKTIIRPTRDPNRTHAAEKPGELLRLLLQLACRAGDKVLDPCCGSGPIFTAAQGLGLHVTGIELNDQYHARACERIASPEPAPESLVEHPLTIDERLAAILAGGAGAAS